MKKLGSSLLALSLLAGGAPLVGAEEVATTEDMTQVIDSKFVKDVHELTLEASKLELKVGETVTLFASALKTGSSVNHSWTVNGIPVSAKSFALNTETGYYESTLEYTAQTAGEYVFEFNIDMQAGKSHIAWEGSESQVVEFIEPTPSQTNENSNGKKLGHIENGGKAEPKNK
ncbi:hypothetical protein M3175_20180 [Robertmurraya korlensis]|uniref:hypothetical protein n=1 Tax=Robertmurraya korlensis TaxID=519977 RepID=UPI00203A4D7D|nr:hypothetical protein [Robertmurraya korlensis]MCM3603062.1 hypothetical protein [Robertmurraya korlensis]